MTIVYISLGLLGVLFIFILVLFVLHLREYRERDASINRELGGIYKTMEDVNSLLPSYFIVDEVYVDFVNFSNKNTYNTPYQFKGILYDRKKCVYTFGSSKQVKLDEFIKPKNYYWIDEKDLMLRHSYVRVTHYRGIHTSVNYYIVGKEVN